MLHFSECLSHVRGSMCTPIKLVSFQPYVPHVFFHLTGLYRDTCYSRPLDTALVQAWRALRWYQRLTPLQLHCKTTWESECAFTCQNPSVASCLVQSKILQNLTQVCVWTLLHHAALTLQSLASFTPSSLPSASGVLSPGIFPDCCLAWKAPP